MSKLRKVRDALEGNPEIKIVKVFEKNYLPGNTLYWTAWAYTVDFFIAPIEGIFSAEKLQKLMLSLVKEPKETMKDDFEEDKTTLRFGKLYFDEIIGEKKIREETSITDTDIILSSGVETELYETVRKEQLKRRVWVRLFPSIKLAENAAFNQENDFSISKKDLKKFQRK